MYPYPNETQIVIRSMMEVDQPFDVEDIKNLIETVLGEDGKYYDPVVEKDLKSFMMLMFEKGHMSGYCLTTKPVCDEAGPKMNIEFIPENSLASLTLINKPESEGKSVTTVLHPRYKDFLKYICKKAECSQEMMVRSIIIRALDLINEKMK